MIRGTESTESLTHAQAPGRSKNMKKLTLLLRA
jgi:hypothetical protein